MTRLIFLICFSMPFIGLASQAHADPLQTLKPEHPRLLASGTDFQRIKQLVQTDPLAKRWHAELKREADQMLEQGVTHYHLPDGRRLLSESRKVKNRVLTLGLLDRLEPNDRYRDRIWMDLEAAAKFDHWNPNHFLDVAEMAFAFAIAYDWLYDRWTPEQRALIRKALVRHAIKPALRAYDRGTWWTKTEINWNQVCNGGLIAAALSIADHEPHLAKQMLERSISALHIPMKRYAPDGGYNEGPGYWNYGTAYNVYAIALLESALGKDFGLGAMPGFDRTGGFPIQATGPTGIQYNFADGKPKRGTGASMFYLASRYNQPIYAQFAAQHHTGSALALLWHRPKHLQNKAKPLPLNYAYRSVGIAVLRSAWDDSDAWYVGAKGGWIGDGHSQLDLGSFILEAKGIRWLIDLGADNYNLPGYFRAEKSGARWRYYVNRAEGHNTLVVNPDGRNEDQPYDATVSPTIQGSTIQMDLSEVYGKGVARSITLGDNDTGVRVSDTLRFEEPAEVWWFAHTRARVMLDKSRRSAILRQDGKQMRARIVSPAGARFAVMPARPLPGSPDPDRQKQHKDVRKLAIHLKAVTDTKLQVVFEPVD